MYAKTHKKVATLALLWCWLLFFIVQVQIQKKITIETTFWFILSITVSRFISILPDIDNPDSLIGKKLFIRQFQPHRGLTHSLLAFGVITLATLPLIILSKWLWIAIFIGFLTHIGCDLITNFGVCLYYPWRKRRVSRFRLFDTGSKEEKKFRIIIEQIIVITLIAIGLLTYKNINLFLW